MNLAGYRAAMGALLGSAVDASTWTTAILDEGLRNGLVQIDPWIVYEDEFAVVTAGRSQNVTITRLNTILTIAWPWQEGVEWAQYKTRWRWVAPNTRYFTHDIPQAGDKIRVRFTLRHAVENLDGATATSVPDRWERPLVYMGCAEALRIRARQLSENPAVPRDAARTLERIADGWQATAGQVWATEVTNPVWASYGLD
jgi:hypothetical protein